MIGNATDDVSSGSHEDDGFCVMASFLLLTSAIMRITETNQRFPPARDLVDLEENMLPCKAETAQEALTLLKEGNAAFLE